ncbi:MAG TPA: alcohol dehydrogenase catalytic domain-containing protein [Steroidobacteraceae bacterium]|nr:alcohol dehydrogenase catalytic domain-containing protein [Steroidobacteraceae bacterium]
MKVAVVHGPGDLRLDEAPPPRAGDGDVLVKVAAAGICGTDLHFRSMGPRFNRPMPLGHEFAGRVVEVGPRVKSFKVGDRVAYNSNNSPADMGRGGECGGFSDYVVLREVEGHLQSLCRVPDNVSLDHAALVEPMSVATHAVNRAKPEPHESVTVFGVGPIGLGIVMALKMRGIEDVVAFDLSPLRCERALALGARAAYDPREKPPAEVLGELRGHRDVWGVSYPLTDIYFEASGAQGLLSQIAAFCNKQSRIIIVAMQRHPVTFDGTKLMSKETSLIGAQGYPSEFPLVMEKLSAKAVDPESMITHRFPFARFMEAFETANDAHRAAKVLLQFD